MPRLSACPLRTTPMKRSLNKAPKGLELPLVLEGDGGKTKTVMVDPTKPFEVDAGFPVKRTKWDPERTVLAFVR